MPASIPLHARTRGHLGVLATWLLAAWLVMLPASLRPGTLLVTGRAEKVGLPRGDQAFFLHALWWTPQAVFVEHSHPWFSPRMGAPDGVSLYYSSIAPLLGVVSVPLRTLFNLVWIYNFWVMMCIALLPFFVGAIVWDSTHSRTGIFLAGLAVLYPPFLHGHLGHLNILSAWWIPAVYWCHLRARRSRGIGWAAATGTALGACFYVSFYHTIHAVAVIGLDVVWDTWTQRRGARARRPGGRYVAGATGLLMLGTLAVWPLVGGAVLIAVLVLGFARTLALRWSGPWGRGQLTRDAITGGIAACLIVPFLALPVFDARLRTSRAGMDLSSKVFWSAQPLSYLLGPRAINHLVSRGSLGGDDLMRLRGEGEFAVFPGYGLWLLVIAGMAWRQRDRAARTVGDATVNDPPPAAQGPISPARWLVYAGILALFSFGPVLRWGRPVPAPFLPMGALYLPAAVFHFFPLLEGYRAFVRLGYVVHLCLAIFAGVSWPAVEARLTKGQARRRFLAVGLAAAALLAGRLNVPATTQEVRVPPFYGRLAKVPGPLLLCEFPVNAGQFLYPMTMHGHRLKNYYLSRLDPARREEKDTNAFLSWLSFFDEPIPEQRRRTEPLTTLLPRVREDFDRLCLDGLIVHRTVLPPGDESILDAFLLRGLELERIHEDDDILFYRNPRGRRFEFQ